jgi:hypothetical protein
MPAQKPTVIRTTLAIAAAVLVAACGDGGSEPPPDDGLNCDNAAFEENARTELAYLLGRVAGQMEMRSKLPNDPNTGGLVLDSNGNRIGKWEIK